MSRRLDDTIERHLCHLLYHEPCCLGLLLREGNALAMCMTMFMGMSSLGVCVAVMCLFAVAMRCVSIVSMCMSMSMFRVIVSMSFVRMFCMVMIVLRAVVTMRCMRLVRMVVMFVVVLLALPSTASSKECRCTQASQSRESFCHSLLYNRYTL